jgi:hypothetical protein
VYISNVPLVYPSSPFSLTGSCCELPPAIAITKNGSGIELPPAIAIAKDGGGLGDGGYDRIIVTRGVALSGIICCGTACVQAAGGLDPDVLNHHSCNRKVALRVDSLNELAS